MKKHIYIIFLSLCLHSCITLLSAQDTSLTAQKPLVYQGQLSGWGHYNPLNTMPLQMGGRYIFQLNSQIKLQKERKFDFEGSANLLGTTDIRPFDSVQTYGDAKPYRLWARYSTKQTELRLGLQKINFGSATLLRPLMWFDQIDPRDPQQLTNGVYGLLGRYYFLNNTNIWLWGLYGNKEQGPWDIGKSNPKIPEMGGRVQMPVKKGEIALTFHHRKTYMEPNLIMPMGFDDVPENRIGFDAKFDVVVGLWAEASLISKTEDVGMLTNQHLITIGSDYTFGIGNGLNIIYEHLIFSADKKAFTYNNVFNFSAFSVNYPLSMYDNVNYIAFFDYTNKAFYNFLNWQHSFGKISAHLMLYVNPEKYMLPQQGNTGNQFAGKGAQLLIIYKH